MNDLNLSLTTEKQFYNVIRKQFEYLECNSNTNKVKYVQEMAECGLSFEVPIYLLLESVL